MTVNENPIKILNIYSNNTWLILFNLKKCFYPVVEVGEDTVGWHSSTFYNSYFHPSTYFEPFRPLLISKPIYTNKIINKNSTISVFCELLHL